MNNDTYKINAIGSDGTANITYKVWANEYTQDLINLPTDDADALKTALDQYVTEAKAQLEPPEDDTPPAVADMLNQSFEV